ncbi:hypothetical protein ETB97_002772 [Aspergillus alliaceus]|uniref:Major facilitator superfamily (MFS) profile domain-containing protein n=1 Tax=Petromyces alliaceus TaxID=209559 RepID=A0A8H6E4V1_PETAA|nr:hypothetical protein ETB97_002772 [Aspergillus burnettii]
MRKNNISNNVPPNEMQISESPKSGNEQRAGDEGVLQRKLLRLPIDSGLCLSVFCQALDTSIIATAIPRVTDEFNSLGDVGWYGSAYLMANCASLLHMESFTTFSQPNGSSREH